jgi:RNA-directed DNA polymerase
MEAPKSGWRRYFRRAETPSVFSTVDEWLRHRVRMMQLKQWKRGTPIYRAMRCLGASVDAAQLVAVNPRRWWKNSAKLLHTALPTSYYGRMGVPRLAG